MAKKYVTLFSTAKDIHLGKDVGMIAYTMHKKYGYNSCVACYCEDTYLSIEKELKGLELVKIEKRFKKDIFNELHYLLHNSKSIDVLHLFFWGKSTFLKALLYKMLNPKGSIYVKCDLDKNGFSILQNKILKKIVFSWILKLATAVSVETQYMSEKLTEQYKQEVLYIPNGYLPGKPFEQSEIGQENIILTVGRLGTEAKATEILLNAYKLIYRKIENWKLILVGSIEPEFNAFIDELFCKEPKMKEHVQFYGVINDKTKLDELYKKSKIFVLPSRHEGFALVLSESLARGCYIVASDGVTPIYDVIVDEKVGKVVEVNDVEGLAQTLVEATSSEYLEEPFRQYRKKNAENKFTWNVICEKLSRIL